MCDFFRSKSKLIAGVKKSITPRTGLVDALAPPAPITPSALPQSNASTPVGVSSVSKEIKKSQLKDRMLSAAPQPVARQDSNSSIHHRSDSAPSLSSGKTEKFRSETGVPSSRPDNGAVKFDPNKHRQRPDSTCSAARTEIHHITKDPNKANFRQQGEIFHASNHSRTTDSNQTNNTRQDHSSDSLKPPRSEPLNLPKGSSVQVRSDLGIVKSDNSSHSSRPVKVDSIKPRHDPAPIQHPRGSEVSKPSRSETNPSSELKTRFDPIQNVPKVDSTQNKTEVIQPDMSLVNSLKLNKISKGPPTSVSSAANSLASFVDSGLRWTETPGVLDLSEDQQQPRPPPKTGEPVIRAVETPVVKESMPKVEETEDQESLLQRDLAMVLEEISQITRLVEGKDQLSAPLNQQMTKASDSRTKSVIKSTASMSSSQLSTSVPVLTPPNPPSRPLSTGGSSLPPKLTAANRTPPPPLAVSTSVSRISSSPTGSNTSVNLISPTQTHSSRTISPVSSDHLKSGNVVHSMISSLEDN